MYTQVQKTIDEDSRLCAYLRKSREDKDVEDTLAKHEQQLQEYVTKQGFKNVRWFKEIGSADSIDEREVFCGVLDEISRGMFDAILVIHCDRLTRGSQTDAGRVSDVLKGSNTLILTPTKQYDLLFNESDEMMFEMETFIARSEYRAIKRRLKAGKVTGTKQGKFTNGTPQFPYYYDKNTKSVMIDEEKRKIYDYMMKLYIEDNLSCTEIAIKFNELNIPTISGKQGVKWRENVVKRLLKSEFHLGYVYHGKFVQVNGKEKELTSGYEKYVGKHEAIKTEEQHAQIITKLKQRANIPHRARSGNFLLSGLIKCAFCGSTMTFITPSHHKNPQTHVKKCHRVMSDGVTKCSENVGIAVGYVLEALKHDMIRYKNELFEKQSETKKEVNDISSLLSYQENVIDKCKKQEERLLDLYLDEKIDKNVFEERKMKLQNEIMKAEQAILTIKEENDLLSKYSDEQRMDNWSEIDVEDILFNEDIPVEVRNKKLKNVIKEIVYKRTRSNENEIKFIYH